MASLKKIQLSKVYIDSQIKKDVCRVLDGGHYILGKECRSLEDEFAEFVGTKYAVLVGSGTAALWLTLMALGVKPEDEIIVPSHTAFPTIEPILSLGAKPVFTDIDENYLIDPSKIEKSITSRTVGIVPVHIYGNPANMDMIKKIARKNKIFILEDCCQAHGAKFKEKMVGSMGIAGCFSFYPSKNLTVCGDGGIVVTGSRTIDKKIRMLRDHGRTSKYTHNILGYNERFNEIQAAIGRALLRKLGSFTARRRAIAALYTKLLKDLPVILPRESEDAYHVYHMFVVRVKGRDRLAKLLAGKGIETGIHYPIPAHLQRPILSTQDRTKLPVTEKICGEILSLPMHPLLKDADVVHICTTIRNILSNGS